MSAQTNSWKGKALIYQKTADHRYYKHLRCLVGPMEGLLERYFNLLVKVGFFRPINAKIAVKIYFGIWSNIFGLRDLYFGKGIIFIPEESEFGEFVDNFLLGMLKNPSP